VIRTPFEEVYIPDLSAIIDGALSKLILEQGIKGLRILIPREIIDFAAKAVLEGNALGLAILTEIAEARSRASQNGVNIEIVDIGLAKIDDLNESMLNRAIYDYARRVNAVIVSSNKNTELIAQALGVRSIILGDDASKIWFEDIFEKYRDVMSLHLKEGLRPLAKRGTPANWRLTELNDYSTPMDRPFLEKTIQRILALTRRGLGLLEVQRRGTTIVQFKDYRIVITLPPVSTGIEMTITRPLIRMKLEDYSLPEKLLKRLEERAEGILIAGAPGAGKTTFAQALAEYYSRKDKIVKTIEAPRDMRLPPTVSQYSKTHADLEELYEILLLTRPDYTVFDEMRTDSDFRLYVDLRLAGIGMIGVLHASSPIDAIQRFVNRVDIGMIPSIIDTVIFIERGQVKKVYELSLTVRLPTGLREAELARPVVEVRDFITGDLEYEIYTFGEQTVIVPVKSLEYDRIRDQVASIVKRILPTADIEVKEGKISIVIPRYSYSQGLASKIRRLKKRLEKLGFEIEVKIA